jgi:LysM repeat protein
VQKKTVEGEYIPKSQRSGTPSTESTRRGNTYQGSTGGGGKEPPLRANPSDRFGGGRGQGPQGRMPKRAVGAGVVAGAAATSLGDGEAKKTTPSRSGGGSSYTIKKGDTLSAIAKDSGVRLAELRDANPQIKDLNKIMPGQKIKLPGQTIKGSGKSIYEGMTKAEMEKMAMKQKSRAGRGAKDISAKTEADTLAMLRQEKLRRQNKETTAKKAKGGMAKKSYAKGGYVNCGASMKPTQKSSKGIK